MIKVPYKFRRVPAVFCITFSSTAHPRVNTTKASHIPNYPSPISTRPEQHTFFLRKNMVAYQHSIFRQT